MTSQIELMYQLDLEKLNSSKKYKLKSPLLPLLEKDGYDIDQFEKEFMVSKTGSVLHLLITLPRPINPTRND